jgi:integrase
MPITKLTGAVIGKLKPAEDGKRLNYFDSQHKGLCLRVGVRDKTWAYHYRFNGMSRSPALGKYAPTRMDHMDREGAIAAANQIDSQIEQGIDPKTPKTALKPKPKPTTANPNALKSRVKQYLKLYRSEVKPSTYGQAKRVLAGAYLQSLAETDISKITRVQLVELLEDMDETPVMANRLHAYLAKFFNWCWDRGYVDPSPMAGLKKRFKEKARKRYLSADEIKQLWNACLDLGYPLGDWCRFTLATGQRPGECRNLSRDDLHNGIWLVEGGDPKNDERHRIPLPKIAREIIKAAPEFKKPFVFTTTGGEKPITQGGKPYAELYEAVAIETDWRPHDLRRTFQTLASEELDIEPYLLGAICNQISVAKPGVSSVYNQAKWMKPKEEALGAWNTYLSKITK